MAFKSLWFLVFSIPWENTVVMPGLGTATRAIGILVAFAGGIAVLKSGRLRLPCAVHIAMLVFVFWATASYFWSLDIGATVQQIITYFQLLMMVWLIWELGWGQTKVMLLMQAYVLGAYVSVGQTIVTYLVWGSAYVRYSAVGFDPNDLALTLALGIPMAWYVSTLRMNDWQRWIYQVYIPTALVAIFLTASRGGFLAALVSVTVIPWTYLRTTPGLWRKAKLLAYGLMAMSIVILAIPDSSWKRLSTLGLELRGGDLTFRRYIWRAGVEVFVRYPILGVGAGAFPAAVGSVLGRDMVAHNVFLSVLVEQGVVGLGMFLAMIALLLLLTTRMDLVEQRLWRVLIVTWAVGGMSLTWEYRKPTWLLFGLLVAHAAEFRRRWSYERVGKESDPGQIKAVT